MIKFIHRLFNLMCSNLFKFKMFLWSNMLNINIIIILSIFIIRFIYGLFIDLQSLIGFIISFILSSLITSYVLNNFKYSKNIYIRFLQRFIFFNLIFIFSLIFIYYIGYLFGLAGGILKNQENTEKASSLLGQCLQKLTTSKNNLDSGEIEKGKENFNAAHDCITKVMDMISKPKNNFHIDLSPIYQYLDSLTLLEESALLHICFFTLIFFISINIISTLFANEMILYFNLGDKHPYLKKLLLLRSKFQRYYFILNFSLLFIIIIVALSLNLIILI